MANQEEVLERTRSYVFQRAVTLVESTENIQPTKAFCLVDNVDLRISGEKRPEKRNRKYAAGLLLLVSKLCV